MNVVPLFVLVLCLLFGISCGTAGSMNCAPQMMGVTINSSSATAFHDAPAPLNQVTYVAVAKDTVPKGCTIAVTPTIVTATWSVSDPTDISLATTSTQTVATCLHATSSPATVTAVVPVPESSQTLSGATTLDCQ